jgi:hypothetical protein
VKKRKRRRKKKQVSKPKCLPPWGSRSPLKSAKSKRRKGMKKRRKKRDMEG